MTKIVEVQVPAPVQMIEVQVPSSPQIIEMHTAGPQGPRGPAVDISDIMFLAGISAAKDGDDFIDLQADAPSIFLQNGADIDLDDVLPSSSVWGPGSLTVNDVEVSGTLLAYDPINSNAVYRPNIYAHGVDDDYNGLPPNNATEAHYNLILAPGFREGLPTFPANNKIRRCTFSGIEVATRLQEAERVEANGNASLKYAKFVERCTLNGSLTGQWFGIDPADDVTGKAFLHDLLWNGGVPISDPAWDAFGLETDRPGTRAEIAAFNAWAASKDDVRENVCTGRDSFVELVKGLGNTGTGYRSNGLGFAVNYNTATGRYSLFNNWGGNGNTADGVNAGWRHQKGDYNFYGAYAAGATHLEGSSGVCIGVNSGNSYSAAGDGETRLWTGDWFVLLGQDAGRKTDGFCPPNLGNRFYLQDRYTRSPLLSGEFANKRLAIGRPVTDDDGILAMLHVYQGDSGFGTTPVAATNGAVVVESNDHSGIMIMTPANKIGGFYMGKPGSETEGGCTYNQSTGEGRLRAANGNRVFWSATRFNSTVPYQSNGAQIAADRKTGWGSPSGTLSRSAYASYTAPTISATPTQAEVQAIANALQALSRSYAALLTDLHFATSGHGLIGT